MSAIKICQQVRENLRYLSTVELDISTDERDLQELGNKLPYPMEYACGCTQGCFVAPNYNAVIKFEIDEDEGACLFSIKRYRIAQEMRVSEILLPIEHANDTFNGVGLYVQPKFTSAHCDLSWRQMREFQTLNENVPNRLISLVDSNAYRSRMHYDWIASAIRVYGKAFMKRFEEFTHRCKVNDLHAANVGYIGNRPVIIDYAGYGTGWQSDKWDISSF